MFSTKVLLALLISSFAQVSWSRSMSLSLNFSMSLDNEAQQQQLTLTPEMIRACMKNTEYSMFELNRLRSTLSAKSTTPTFLANDDNSIEPTEIINGINDDDEDDNYMNTADYDSMSSSIILNEKTQESIQCFAHCLYEQMGLVKNGIFVEQEVFRRIYALTEDKKVEECTNLDSINKCDVAYRLHLCYSKLKSMEAERKIRELIEYSERTADMSEETDKPDAEPDAEPEESGDGIEGIDADSSLNEIE